MFSSAISVEKIKSNGGLFLKTKTKKKREREREREGLETTRNKTDSWAF